ncbi:UNVERIFIED_CONTAM: hypothetical protein FKN15_069489 [Acipenser sinensis]
MGEKRLEEASWCLHFTEVRHYQRESAPQRPPLQRRMERYESWLRDPSTPLWLKTEGRHLLGDSNLDILLDFVRLEPEVQEKAITRGYPGLIEALERMTQMVDWVYQEREERERKGGDERPAPKREEPERPAPKREEAERPAPKREEPERPQPKRGESVRPQPKKGKAKGPQPRYLPAEGEFLLVPPPPPWEDWRSPSVHSPRGGSRCVHSPRGGSQCVHSPRGGSRYVHSPRGGSQCVHNPRGGRPNIHSPGTLPAEGEFLLVTPPSPWEDCESLPPPPAEGAYLLVPPPPHWEDCVSLPPPPAEGEFLLVPPPPLWEDCESLPSPPAEGEFLLVPPPPPWEDDVSLPPPPAEEEYLLVPPPLPWEDCVSLPPPPAEALEEGAAGHEELGGARDSTMVTPQKQLASPSSGTLGLRGEVAVGDMCASHKEEDALPPSQPEGEEALLPWPPEGEAPLPPWPPEGEAPLPPWPPEEEDPLLPLPSRGEEQELPLPPPPLGEVELLLSPSWPGAPLPPLPLPGDGCSASPGAACGSTFIVSGVPNKDQPTSHCQDTNLRCMTHPAHHAAALLPHETPGDPCFLGVYGYINPLSSFEEVKTPIKLKSRYSSKSRFCLFLLGKIFFSFNCTMHICWVLISKQKRIGTSNASQNALLLLHSFHFLIVVYTFSCSDPESGTSTPLREETRAVLSEVIDLIARLEADRQEAEAALKTEKERRKTLGKKIDCLSLWRLQQLPAAVQKEHESCVRDICELQWHLKCKEEIQKQVQERLTKTEVLNQRLQDDIDFVKKHGPLLKEKMKMESLTISLIEKSQEEANKKMSEIDSKLQQKQRQFDDASSKAKEEQQNMVKEMNDIMYTLQELQLWSVSVGLVLLVELTVSWEDSVEEAYKWKKLCYAELAAEMEQQGWIVWVYPVDITDLMLKIEEQVLQNQDLKTEFEKLQQHTQITTSDGESKISLLREKYNRTFRDLCDMRNKNKECELEIEDLIQKIQESEDTVVRLQKERTRMCKAIGRNKEHTIKVKAELSQVVMIHSASKAKLEDMEQQTFIDEAKIRSKMASGNSELKQGQTDANIEKEDTQKIFYEVMTETNQHQKKVEEFQNLNKETIEEQNSEVSNELDRVLMRTEDLRKKTEYFKASQITMEKEAIATEDATAELQTDFQAVEFKYKNAVSSINNLQTEVANCKKRFELSKETHSTLFENRRNIMAENEVRTKFINTFYSLMAGCVMN